MHVGICRSSDTDQSAVFGEYQESKMRNVQPDIIWPAWREWSRPRESLHIYQIYVLPVCLYGIEVVFPCPKFIEKLDKFNKHNLNHILSLPITTADPAVYILSGTLPIEAMFHQWVLTFFGNISRLPVQNKLAFSKLKVKTLYSNRRFVAVRKICTYHVWTS